MAFVLKQLVAGGGPSRPRKTTGGGSGTDLSAPAQWKLSIDSRLRYRSTSQETSLPWTQRLSRILRDSWIFEFAVRGSRHYSLPPSFG